MMGNAAMRENNSSTIYTANEGSWINLVSPTQQELQNISTQLALNNDLLLTVLDAYERPHVYHKNDQVLIVIDIPFMQENADKNAFKTIPLGILLTHKTIVTVCLEKTEILENIGEMLQDCQWQFVLKLIERIYSSYLHYLRQIHRETTRQEVKLYQSTTNKKLFKMFELEKSLVYFSISLKSNETAIQKLKRLDSINSEPDNRELLENIIIENKQAVEMCNIYKNILCSTMSVFTSIISNNLNIIFKLFAKAMIFFSVFGIFTSLWGIRIERIPLGNNLYGLLIVICIAFGVVATLYYIIKKKGFY